VKLIDTHSHLFSDKFEEDRMEVVQRAIDAGVERMYLPNVSGETIESMNALVEAFPENCFPMIGLHPCNVKEDFEKELELVRNELKASKYFGIGETGLDFYWDLTFKELQIQSLKQHIRWAKEYRLPIVLHTRESFHETFEIIEKENDERLTGVFHCFGGSVEDAEKVKSLGGFFIGIGGVATFKKTNHGEVLPNIGLDFVVLETDSPYLAPTPHRGKRNESAYLPLIAGKIAAIMGLPIELVAERTTANAKKLYQVSN